MRVSGVFISMSALVASYVITRVACNLFQFEIFNSINFIIYRNFIRWKYSTKLRIL